MRITLALFAASLLTPWAQSQDTPKLPPPALGPLVSYTYWPTQYVQWIGTELPYSMIELDVNKEAKSPLYYVSLTDRATGKRIHYANAESLVAFAKAQHEEAYKTDIAVESDDTESVGSTLTLRLAMADGKPLQWRFVQGSDISEQGSGLTALPDARIPIFVYREQGGVAGEGTALQVGEVVSTAEVWKEISHPPQFIAYRGAVTKSAHSLIFMPGKDSWTIASAPATLATGATWEMDSPTGNHRSLRIDKVEGSHVTLTASDRFQPSVRVMLEALYDQAGWSLTQIRYAPVRDGDKHFASLAFAPALLPSGDASFSLAFGKKKPVAEGSVKGTGAATEHTYDFGFSSPAWLRGKTMTEAVNTTSDSVSIVAHP